MDWSDWKVILEGVGGGVFSVVCFIAFFALMVFSYFWALPRQRSLQITSFCFWVAFLLALLFTGSYGLVFFPHLIVPSVILLVRRSRGETQGIRSRQVPSDRNLGRYRASFEHIVDSLEAYFNDGLPSCKDDVMASFDAALPSRELDAARWDNSFDYVGTSYLALRDISLDLLSTGRYDVSPGVPDPTGKGARLNAIYLACQEYLRKSHPTDSRSTV